MKGFAKNLLTSCSFVILLSGGVFACTCDGEPRTDKSIDEVRKEKRNYFLNEFAGAAFIGEIIRRKRVNVNWWAKTLAGKPTNYQMYKYTVRVTAHWIGIKSRTVIIYGNPPEQIHGRSRSGDSCGFRLSQGKTFFFTPDFHENNLMISQCDFAWGGSPPKGERATEFKNIMGEPRRF